MKTKTQHAVELMLDDLASLSLCDLRIEGLDEEQMEEVHEEIDALLRDPRRLLIALADTLGVELQREWRVTGAEVGPYMVATEAAARAHVDAWNRGEAELEAVVEMRYSFPWKASEDDP